MEIPECTVSSFDKADAARMAIALSTTISAGGGSDWLLTLPRFSPGHFSLGTPLGPIITPIGQLNGEKLLFSATRNNKEWTTELEGKKKEEKRIQRTTFGSTLRIIG